MFRVLRHTPFAFWLAAAVVLCGGGGAAAVVGAGDSPNDAPPLTDLTTDAYTADVIASLHSDAIDVYRSAVTGDRSSQAAAEDLAEDARRQAVVLDGRGAGRREQHVVAAVEQLAFAADAIAEAGDSAGDLVAAAEPLRDAMDGLLLSRLLTDEHLPADAVPQPVATSSNSDVNDPDGGVPGAVVPATLPDLEPLAPPS